MGYSKTQTNCPVYFKLPLYVYECGLLHTLYLQIKAEEVSGDNQLLELQFSAQGLDKKVCHCPPRIKQ